MSIEHSPDNQAGSGSGLADKYLSTKQVQEYLGNLSKQTLHRYRQNKMFPEPIYLTARKPLWLMSEVEAWAARQSREVPHNNNLKNGAGG
jgi:predicted DNA-binding transcriptional regulator AlpA